MLYNKDPILPFEYADRCDNLVTEYTEYGCRPSTAEPVNPVTSLLSQLKGQLQKLFLKLKSR